MRIPIQASPVIRGQAPAWGSSGLTPQSHLFCGVCKTALKGVIKATGEAGCTVGIAGFEAACNAALDVETFGAAAALCIGAGVILEPICQKYGGSYLVSNAGSLAHTLCHEKFKGHSLC